ncbi:MAG: hypothetical protein ABIF06_01625 [bacterium]
MAETPTLKINFGIENEIDRVTNTLKKLPWYRERGYSESFARLPLNITEGSTLEDIRSVVTSEFSGQRYKEYKDHVEVEWKKISSEIMKLKEISNFNLNNQYSLLLTKYGSGGSYDSRQGLIVSNIEFRSKDEIMGTIIHELVHIGIQHLIDKNNVKHWYKERLVDLMVDKLFPNIKKMQNIKEDISIVDDAFGKFFPNLDKVTELIGGSKI